MASIKFYHRPCGFHTSDPEMDCKFCNRGHCDVGIEDSEGESPCELRKKELEEFEIEEKYLDKSQEERELIVSKMFPCYLHVIPDELIDIIQYYRKKKNSIKYQ